MTVCTHCGAVVTARHRRCPGCAGAHTREGTLVHPTSRYADDPAAQILASRGGATLETVAAALGVSRERVRQIQTAAIAHIRARLPLVGLDASHLAEVLATRVGDDDTATHGHAPAGYAGPSQSEAQQAHHAPARGRSTACASGGLVAAERAVERVELAAEGALRRDATLTLAELGSARAPRRRLAEPHARTSGAGTLRPLRHAARVAGRPCRVRGRRVQRARHGPAVLGVVREPAPPPLRAARHGGRRGVRDARTDGEERGRMSYPIAYATEARRRELRAMSYSDYLRSPEWRQVRWTALHEGGHRCRLCPEVHGLEVHHPHGYECRGAETSADVVVLCDACHNREHVTRAPVVDALRAAGSGAHRIEARLAAMAERIVYLREVGDHTEADRLTRERDALFRSARAA